MTDNIRVLPPPVDENAPDPVTIQIVTALLEKAKEGKLDGFACAYNLRDGRFANEWSMGDNPMVLLGAVDLLHLQMLNFVDNAGDSVIIDQADGPVEDPEKD